MYENVIYYIFLHLYTLLYTTKQFSIFLYVFLHLTKICTYMRKFSRKMYKNVYNCINRSHKTSENQWFYTVLHSLTFLYNFLRFSRFNHISFNHSGSNMQANSKLKFTQLGLN